MFGDKKTLGDLMSYDVDDKEKSSKSESDERDESSTDEGSAPAKLKMEKLASKLGIDDLKSFSELVMLIQEHC